MLPLPLSSWQENYPIMGIDFQPNSVQECRYPARKHKPNSKFKEYYLLNESDE